MLDAGSLILGGCAGLCVACASASRAARSSISVGLCVECSVLCSGPLVPYRATSWLMLGCLGALAVAPLPRLPPSLPLLHSPVCTVLGGGALGQSLLPDDAIRGHASWPVPWYLPLALTHRTGRESEQPLSTPVTDAAADWWMGGRHREWPRGLWMARLLVFLLHGPCPPRAMEPCLVFATHGPHGSGWLLPIDKYQRHPAHIVMSLPLHHHPPPPRRPRHLLDTP